MLPAHEACRWPTRVSSLPKESLRCLSGGSATSSAGRLADYIAKVNLITKVLDFVQDGGPNLTVDGTVFEMWMGI